MPEIASLQLFKILSDETRLGIVLLLREMGELCVCDLCTALEQSQPKTSRHLAMLRESGLLLDRKQGKWVHYRLSRHCCKVSDEAAFCLIQRPYISKTLLTRRISPRGSP